MSKDNANPFLNDELLPDAKMRKKMLDTAVGNLKTRLMGTLMDIDINEAAGYDATDVTDENGNRMNLHKVRDGLIKGIERLEQRAKPFADLKPDEDEKEGPV